MGAICLRSTVSSGLTSQCNVHAYEREKRSRESETDFYLFLRPGVVMAILEVGLDFIFPHASDLCMRTHKRTNKSHTRYAFAVVGIFGPLALI